MAGIAVALVGIGVLSAVMVPARDHLSIATCALVLVVPVVGGVAVGGLPAGLVAVVAGFLAYDVLFIPPYDTLSVGQAQNWVALVVYVVVMLVVARVVVFLQRARADARRQADATERLYVLSDLLIGDRPVTDLLQQVVTTIHDAFGPRWVAALLPASRDDERLTLAATAGQPLSAEELADLSPTAGRPAQLRSPADPERGPRRRRAGRVGDPHRPHRPRPAGRHGGDGRLARSGPTTGSSCIPTPTTPRWPSSAASSASRPCGPSCSRRSTGCATP